MKKIIIDENICQGCELCISVCPKKLIKISKTKVNAKGYHPADIEDVDACVSCAACATICPDIAITIE